MRLAVVASHPVQYYAPLFRQLAKKLDLTVFYCHRASQSDQAQAGFGVGFAWDVDLLSGYTHEFLENVSRSPGLGRFGGVDTPDISKKLNDGNFDVVLVLGWYLKSFLQTLWAAKWHGIPIMVRGDSHLDTPRSSLKRIVKAALYPIFLRQFDAALVVGKRNRNYWSHYNYPQSRMFASPHCIDTSWFEARATPEARAELRQKLGISQDAPVALFAGKLVPFKRPLDVVSAAARVRQGGMPLEVMIAGSGPLDCELRRLAGELQVPLHILGFCNQSEMPAAYAAVDALVLPSTGRETWGLVANEALACGIPVILSDAVGCAPDVAVDPRVSRTFPLGDVAACSIALSAILRHPPSKDEVLAISEKFSLDLACEGVVQALTAQGAP